MHPSWVDSLVRSAIRTSAMAGVTLARVNRGTANSIRLGTRCPCGGMVRADGSPGLTACVSCGQVGIAVCSACGSMRLGGNPGHACEACGAHYALATGESTFTGPARKKASAMIHPNKKTVPAAEIEGVCDVLTGAPLSPGDSLWQCRKCKAFAREASHAELKNHYHSRCPSCRAASSYHPVKVAAEACPKAVFRKINGPCQGGAGLWVSSVQSHPATRSVLLRLCGASGDALPALVTSAHVHKFGGVMALKQWTGKQVLCTGVRAYFPTWGEVRLIRSTGDLKETSV